ncbi:hypothetical protein FVW20_16635 [Desulfovibrio oxamicus]|uniref:Uncharacterized protein n=1 Tax=Nitratidesulfovibrio oxamicus TaxID=32016 RepID=A0ABS0J805_9BACT|nr:hypothetical protein [Nitratidesulfovibrio oxamicus]MBG3878587.1 hypothetical protein [Nitratidesulfovibrio oxamicus]
MTLFLHALPQDTPDRFLLLDRLDSCDETGAAARRVFIAAPPWQGMEAMAQLAALHARWTADFSLHAFLLAVEECTWPDHVPAADMRHGMSNSTSSRTPGATPGGALHGTLHIGACLLAESDRAATYATTVTPLTTFSGADSAPAPPCMAATLTIGRAPYDTRFNGDTLTARYRETFAWLTRTA